MHISNETRTLELNRYFMIMGNLAQAKAAADAALLAEWIDEIEVMARHSAVPMIRTHAKREAAQAVTLLADLQAKHIGIIGVAVTTRAALPANLN